MNYSKTRRKFFKQISVGGAAFMLTPVVPGNTAFFKTGLEQFSLPGILPVAVIEDCFDLSFTLPGISNITKIALVGDIDLKIPGNKGRLALGLLPEKKELLGVLEKIKNRQDGKKSEDHDKLSILLGLLCNNILYREMKPVYKKYGEMIEELSIYQDTFILRTLAGTDASRVNQENLDMLLKVLMPRVLTRVHTLIPDSGNGPEWITKMVKWRKDNYSLMEKYAQVYTNPDPAKEKKYVNDLNFYDPEDAIIKLCRESQNGERVSAATVAKSIDTAMKNGSLYARIIANGVNGIRLVDDYLKSAADGQKLSEQLKI